MVECVRGDSGKKGVERFKAKKGEPVGGEGAVHLYKPKNLSSVGSRFLRWAIEVVLTGRTFSPSFGAANDITEIVFVALPGSGTPGKASGSGGSGRKGARRENREGINNWFLLKPLKV